MKIQSIPMFMSGLVILILSVIMMSFAIFQSSMLAWLAPEPRYYIPTIGLILSMFLLACCYSSPSEER
ncbi:hypothetical protein BFU36_05605 [Sulfolobus sp. A20]|uniref:hypothetical protein n=1 Tax=Sulfolobaceae TaxID=118883 RepID=UPI000845BF24|nr:MULTISPECIES: hypothetical protein [unclassified Sulfolobus]TRM77341.1 hypothetical protein DJ532_04705 [Sulfolobus sp. A20-N-F8]TRM79199.1 hypothetical protein DJ528_02345 [Sulfolobus sp. B5]TRM80184.1 hypothetical protein DJ531_12580 [Sulfolobus sp. A20-N-F6]TRM81036.1 hypothetical protein DJ524_05510 [Sulfolobus sp. D5]TRM83450.1 hypothetical protein DJ522_06235 [Sulfolobus sp. F3]TRM85041.1 hypothetical protein DJ521_07895 [Sulfolobus sp. E3]TRM88597.1 hypothetical protein DJ529_04700